METQDKREGWLRELKIGSKVLVSTDRYGSAGCSYSYVVLSKVTKSGTMSTDKQVFDQYGHLKGREKWDPLVKFIERTPAIEAAIAHQKAQASVKRLMSEVDLGEATTEQLLVLAEALRNMPRPGMRS